MKNNYEFALLFQSLLHKIKLLEIILKLFFDSSHNV